MSILSQESIKGCSGGNISNLFDSLLSVYQDSKIDIDIDQRIWTYQQNREPKKSHLSLTIVGRTTNTPSFMSPFTYTDPRLFENKSFYPPPDLNLKYPNSVGQIYHWCSILVIYFGQNRRKSRIRDVRGIVQSSNLSLGLYSTFYHQRVKGSNFLFHRIPDRTV